MAATYSATYISDRGTLTGHIRAALFIAMLTAVITLAFMVFENRPPEPFARIQEDPGVDYIPDTAEPAAVDAQPVAE